MQGEHGQRCAKGFNREQMYGYVLIMEAGGS